MTNCKLVSALYACMMYGGGGGGAQCSVILAIQHVEYPPKNI